MIQIISYEVEKSILIVGFKVNDFVVYSSIGYDSKKTKQQLLQLAYEQVKQTIDYEKTLDEHSFVTEEGGEEFTPEPPKPTKLDVNFDSLTGKVLDQYGNVFDGEVIFTIDSDVARIEDGIIVEDEVEEDTEYKIIASYNDLIVQENRIIYLLIPSETDILKNEIEELKQVIDVLVGGEDNE